MNTLNIGQDITFIAGLRVESENNHYNNKYSKTDLSGFPVPLDRTRDTTADYSETIYLPNFQVKIKATDFLNVRLAAYRALARPDFNMRLNTYFAWRPSDVGSNKQLILGNPILKTAKAWNFEVNTSFYGNDIGLISLSAFYKEIKDMYHMLNQINTDGNVLLERLGLEAKTIHKGTYQLTVPYNSPKPSKVWGMEFEHQINFTFLPGWLQNFVLSYNFSAVRSETWLIGNKTDTTYVTQPGIPWPKPVYSQHAVDNKQQLEEQPEFYGNISLGYDIDGFSARISMFHQSEYNIAFSSTGRSDNVRGAYTRFDLALKQKVSDILSFQLNVNNLTNIQEDNFLEDRVNGYRVLRSSELYGLSAELGVRVDL
jgi:TonB-dependent receptor